MAEHSHLEIKCSDIIAPPPSDPKIQIPEDNVEYFDGRQIHRVPQHHRLKGEDYYTPRFVSLGPYHHGSSEQLSIAEAFKPEVMQTVISGSSCCLTREILYSRIFNVIDQIRNCYVGISEGEYNNESLTEMMLLDSCFFISIMQMTLDKSKELKNYFSQHLGRSAIEYIYQDLYLLENQIPFWVIQLMVSSIYSNNKKKGLNLVRKFFSCACLRENPKKLKIMPTISFGNKQPLHSLDACRLIKLGKKPEPVQQVPKWIRSCRWRGDQDDLNSQFRSVTDLKAKGVFFRHSTDSLQDIQFKSYTLFALLKLPHFPITNNSKGFFLNVIAYESSPKSIVDDVDTIYYLNFMKSLILKPQDVRELRENKILFSTLLSDEQVFQVIKEIDTFGVNDLGEVFNKVKERIDEHCSSKAKTWIAECFSTYFRSPWTVIALVAITFQLLLSVVQTYYAMHPAS